MGICCSCTGFSGKFDRLRNNRGRNESDKDQRLISENVKVEKEKNGTTNLGYLSQDEESISGSKDFINDVKKLRDGQEVKLLCENGEGKHKHVKTDNRRNGQIFLNHGYLSNDDASVSRSVDTVPDAKLHINSKDIKGQKDRNKDIKSQKDSNKLNLCTLDDKMLERIISMLDRSSLSSVLLTCKKLNMVGLKSELYGGQLQFLRAEYYLELVCKLTFDITCVPSVEEASQYKELKIRLEELVGITSETDNWGASVLTAFAFYYLRTSFNLW